VTRLPGTAIFGCSTQSKVEHPISATRQGWNARPATSSPAFPAGRTNGNHLDIEVVDAFKAQPIAMREEAQALEVALREWGDNPHAVADPDLPDDGVDEGRVLLPTHLRRERSSALKKRKLAEAARQGQAIACEVCDFDFFATYGERGTDYIECHHRTPLHTTRPTLTRLTDLALICSNCHRMIRRNTPWLSIEDLTAIVHTRRQLIAGL
jgi:5-methylcytosine-specific restriction protein A